jgi:hypothetical protein
MQVTITLYDEDRFCEDFESLPEDAQADFLSYLDALQRNPDNPSLRTESHGHDRWAYQFHAQYVVYCRLERGPSAFTDLLGQVIRIEVLSIDLLSKAGLYNSIMRRVRGRLGI